MKKFILLLAYGLFTQFVMAQKVQWGPLTEKESKYSSVKGVIGKDKEAIYVVMQVRESRLVPFQIDRVYAGEYTLLKYDRNLKPIKEVELQPKIDKKLLFYEFGMKFNNKLCMFFSQFNRKEDKNELYLQIYNPETLDTEGELSKICAVEGLNEVDSGTYRYGLSQDSSKILIVGNATRKKSKQESFLFTVLGQGIKQVWQKDISLPYTEMLFSLSDIKSDNEGNIYILGKNYKEKLKDTRKGEINYTYELFTYTNNGQNVNQKTINLDNGQFVSDLSFVMNKEGIKAVVGFYSNKDSDNIAGTFIWYFDETTNISKKEIKPFTPEFLSTFGKRQKKDNELKDFIFKDLILRDDGSMMAIAERYFVISTTYTTATGRTGGRTRWYFADLILVNISKDLSINSIQSIHKFQTFVDGYSVNQFSSYSTYQKDNHIYIMYGDDYKNATAKSDEETVAYNTLNPALMMVKIAPDGNISKEMIIHEKEEVLMLSPPFFKDIGDNEMFIYGETKTKKGKKKYKIGKIIF